MDPASARHQTKLLRRGFKKQGETNVASGPTDMVYVMKSMTKINLTLNHIYVNLKQFFSQAHVEGLQEKDEIILSSQMISVVGLLDSLMETPSPKDLPATKRAAFEKKVVDFHTIFNHLLTNGIVVFHKNPGLKEALVEAGNKFLAWTNSKFVLDNVKAPPPDNRSEWFRGVMTPAEYEGNKTRIQELQNLPTGMSSRQTAERLQRMQDVAEYEQMNLQGSGRRFYWK